jgi:hypothetical protein
MAEMEVLQKAVTELEMIGFIIEFVHTPELATCSAPRLCPISWAATR